MMGVSMALEIPWPWICENFGWQLFRGMARAVGIDVDIKIEKYRHRGDPCCLHAFKEKK